MKFEEAAEAIAARGMYGRSPGVCSMAALLEKAGHPERRLRIVHIAGTNGKGSTARYTAALLRKAGHLVGLYTSPHLVSMCERIAVDGEDISREAFARLAGRALLEEGTASDLLLWMAVEYFVERGCEFAVVETGLGGRLDQTNALTTHKAAEVSCITRIGLDHTRLLGDTYEAIAAEKAGILRPGTTAVLAEMEPRAKRVLVADCEKKCIDWVAVEENGEADEWVRSHASGLYATYQKENLANAVVIMKCLGIDLPDSKEFSLPIAGRLEAFWGGRLLIDGAHNPQGAAALSNSLKGIFSGESFDAIIGILKDKDADGILEPMLPLLASVCAVGVGSGDRYREPEDLVRRLSVQGVEARACASVKEALRLLRGEEIDVLGEKNFRSAQWGQRNRILVFGSLSLVGEIKKL
ncbi:MAG: hypothetical protein IJ679_01420 [Lachnospiraceae bacterium]|nr:hypothetical protein [Lachnospiraceae bacterium]